MAIWKDIVNAAESLYNERDKYCYFYGAKGQVMTDSRMNALWNASPSYFKRYSAAQKKQIFDYSRGKIGLDCSGFVCLCLEKAGVINRGQWTYSTALISKCKNIKTNITAKTVPAGAPLYTCYHGAGRHIGLKGNGNVFYDIASEGNSIRKLSLDEWRNWEQAGEYPGVDYSSAFDALYSLTASAKTPTGYLDVVTETSISGWAWNSTDYALTCHVYVYKDGKEVDRFATVASQYRADLKSAGIGNGQHAFHVDYDFAAKHGQGEYLVKVYAIDPNSSMNPQLQNEKTVKVDKPATYAAWVGKVTEMVNVRTAADKNSDIYLNWPLLGVGNLVDVIGEETAPDGGKWYVVRIANKHTACVNAKYIVKV